MYVLLRYMYVYVLYFRIWSNRLIELLFYWTFQHYTSILYKGLRKNSWYYNLSNFSLDLWSTKMSFLLNLFSRKPTNFIDEKKVERQQPRPPIATVNSQSSHSINEPRFVTNRPGGPSNPSGASSNPFNGKPDEKEDSIQTKIQQSKNRQLESQRRTLKDIYESEQFGTGIVAVLTCWFFDICSPS